MAAARLPRAGQGTPPAVEGRAARGANRVNDLGRGDRAVEAALRAGPDGQPDGEALKLGLDLVGVPEIADLTGARVEIEATAVVPR